MYLSMESQMKICPVCKKLFKHQDRFCPQDGTLLEELVGRVLDEKYKIEKMLGKGAMGVVYLATDIVKQRQVAIKMMLLDYLSNPEQKQRFVREAMAYRRFSHPNSVEVYDLCENSDGMIYMVMEYIDGSTLSDELDKKGRFSPGDALTIIEPIALALNEAHKVGVVHRDLKPANIMIGETEEGQQLVKLLDLSIAKLYPLPNSSQSSLTQLTKDDQILGTPYYMSPEQWGTVNVGELIDGRSDIYSLAVVLYELITGKKPFEGGYWELAVKHIQETPQPPHELFNDIPRPFSQVVLGAMAKYRDERPPTCESFIKQLQRSLIATTEEVIRAASIIDQIQLLPVFEFNTVVLGEDGEVVESGSKQASYFIESFGHEILLEMVSIPAGSFVMGADESELESQSYERPKHMVTVKGFYIGKYQVTQLQWQAIMKNNPSFFIGDTLPVEQISWMDAVEFCKKLSAITGRKYRLPTEAEWEYACRAGTETPFAFGQTLNTEIANYRGDTPYGLAKKGVYRAKTVPVGSLGTANNFGLYDMHGNVWEWCQDIFHDSYLEAPNDGTSWEAWSRGATHYRIFRGGSWYNAATHCRTANRGRTSRNAKAFNIGLRLAVSL